MALRLIELASDDNASPGDLAGVIAQDPSLSVRLLILASSAAFYGGRAVKTLDQAIVRIGFNRLRIMALSISIKDAVPMSRSGHLNYEQFWKNSLYRGVLARGLARLSSAVEPDEAFLAGLILEIGLPMFLDLLGKDLDAGITLDFDSLEATLAWETHQFGINHRQVGRMAMNYWKLPGELAACQSVVAIDDSRQPPPLAVICCLAEALANALFYRPLQLHAVSRQVQQRFGIGNDALRELLGSACEQVEDASQSFAVRANSQQDLLEILERSKEALARLSQKMAFGSAECKGGGAPSMETLRGEDSATAVTLQAVAHEIRNPLMALGGFANRLAKTLDSDSTGGRYAKLVLEEAKRLESTLAELTRLSMGTPVE